MSGRKPMSSMRSASSSTTIWIDRRSSEPRPMWSRMRPGVPMTMSAPFCSLAIWPRIGLPP